MSNDAYVWQRRWNDDLRAALEQSAPSIREFHVLAAEANAKGDLTGVSIDRETLRRIAKPVIAVIRIDSRGGISTLGGRLADQTAALAADWKKGGVPILGIEIDYDCAASRLPQYGDFLRLLRARADPGLTLIITALPSWMGSEHLSSLLKDVDETVLQVHSVMSPRKGLFDRKAAYRWAQAWSRITPAPFRIALPTYWSRVTWDKDGRVESIESEVARYGTGPEGRELMVDPREVGSMVSDLRNAPPRNLAGLAWFRLPTGEDRRAWAPRTWQAVMQGRDLRKSPPVARFQAGAGGVTDVYVRNESDLDAKLPAQISIPAQSCDFANAMAPYDLERESNVIRFVLKNEDLVRSGRERLIGWLRCSEKSLGAHVSY